jgi:MFS family permease
MPSLGRNERLNTLNGILNSMAANLVAPFTVIFALKLGADNVQTALLSSGPAIAGLLVLIPGARWVDRHRDRFKITAALMAGNRTFYLLMALVPFLLPPVQASVFIVLVTVMNAPGAVANAAWQSTMAQTIGADRRADAFAARNKAMNVFGTATALAAGALLDVIPSPWGYQLMFAGAFFVALAEVKVFLALRPEGEPTAAEEVPVSPGTAELVMVQPAHETVPILHRIRSKVDEIRSNQTFVRYTLASILFYFGWQTPWTIFSLYQVKELGAGNFWISLLALLNTGGSLVGYGFWVKQIEKRGNLFVVWVSALPLVAVPLVYALSHSLIVIAVLTVFIGVTLSGLIVALFNSLLEATPELNRTSYIAYYNTAVTVTSIVAPLWGVLVFEWWGFRTAFLICFAQRIIGTLALFLLWRGEASRSRSIPDRG